MTETTSRVPTTCPACSPDIETVHEVLKPATQATVRCTDCGHVHKTRLDTTSTVELSVVVSQDGESFTATTDAPETEQIAVGEEFILETETGIFTVRITSLELANGERTESATATDVATVWTRAVGNVAVPVTIHPAAGTGDRNETYSRKVHVPGDFEFVVGKTVDIDEAGFAVEGIHLRDDAIGYDHTKLDHEGDSAVAKDINRVYGRDTTTDAWSVW